MQAPCQEIAAEDFQLPYAPRACDRPQPVDLSRGPTDQGGMISLTNFSVRGPAGMYTLVPTANGISSTEAPGSVM